MLTSFSGNLYCALETGHVIVVGGRSIDSASKVNLSLSTGKVSLANVALHISVRFHDDVIVRNSKLDGQWGNEEREDNLHESAQPNPLIAGDTFEVYIFVGDDRFHIAVNGAPHSTYKFRMPLDDIRCLVIDKDVQYIHQIDHRQAYPSPYPFVQFREADNSFSNDTPKPFIPGHVIVVTAIPFGNANGSFIMRFTQGATQKESLHFNPRFDSKVVVRNSHNESGNWLTEERDGAFPFVIDQQFKLAIALTNQEFKFAVNGRYFASYTYKAGANVLNQLNGFKTYSNKGLQLEISSVDHIHMGQADCEGFESYSDPDVSIL